MPLGTSSEARMMATVASRAAVHGDFRTTGHLNLFFCLIFLLLYFFSSSSSSLLPSKQPSVGFGVFVQL